MGCEKWFAAEQEGRLKLGGIMMGENSPDWLCTGCGHEWADPDCKRRLFSSISETEAAGE
jgi:hypothetical protein